jgi:hypothetical protein
MLSDLIYSVPGAPCLICNTPTQHYDFVEFSKNCEERRGTFLPPTGIMVDFNRCTNCGHVFAPCFSKWTPEDFTTHIYNKEYLIADPEYPEIRPSHFGREIHRLFGNFKSELRHVDYGGGDGLTSDMLKSWGWDTRTYDPYGKSSNQIPEGKFNLVTAFEVFEHSPDPQETMRNISKLLDDPGILLLTTGFSDGEIDDERKLKWWYASPRNGHISFFTKQSIIMLAQQYGLNIAFDFHGITVMFKTLPHFMKQNT